MPDLPAFLGAVAADRELWSDFLALCGFGGRLTGSPGERAALDWAAGRLAAIGVDPPRRDPTRYDGWVCRRARLTDLRTAQDLDVTPLLAAGATPPDGLTLDVVDCGRGAPEQIAAADVRGCAVLVRHEYPFASGTIHRRLKLAAAVEAGAAAFLIAQSEPGFGPVAGSAGAMPSGRMIPALGISAEAAEALAALGSRVRLTLEAEDQIDAATETLVLDVPGAGPDRVVLSAHVDGHELGESALDNATGLAAALALARAAAPYVSRMPRGLTVCVFSAEEWALTGSRIWLKELAETERARLVFNLNLDSIAGSSRLTALTSGFDRLGAFVRDAAGMAGFTVAVHRPLMTNSDHANFAAHGIPALRLVAGFDEPNSRLRHLLTRADTRLLATPGELKAATLTAATILWAALTADDETLAGLR